LGGISDEVGEKMFTAKNRYAFMDSTFFLVLLSISTFVLTFLLGTLLLDWVTIKVLFFLPLGAIFFGSGLMSGTLIALTRKGVKPSALMCLGASLVGGITYVCLYYWDYSTFYLNGVQISSYSYEGNPITFFSYLKLIIENTSVSFFYRFPSLSLGEPLSVPWYNYLSFALEIGGSMAASGGLLLSLKASDYCQDCRLFYSKSHLVQFSAATLDNLKSINYECAYQINNCDDKALEFLINLHDDISDEYKGNISLSWCPNCFKGNVTVEFSKLNRRSGCYDSIEVPY